MDNKELGEQRFKANLQLVRGLENYFRANENLHLRFLQGLWDLNIITEEDNFHEEPMRTLERLNHYMPDLFTLEEPVIENNNIQEVIEDLRKRNSSLEAENEVLKSIISNNEIELKNLRVKNETLLLEMVDGIKQDKETMEEFIKLLISKRE